MDPHRNLEHTVGLVEMDDQTTSLLAGMDDATLLAVRLLSFINFWIEDSG